MINKTYLKSIRFLLIFFYIIIFPYFSFYFSSFIGDSLLIFLNPKSAMLLLYCLSCLFILRVFYLLPSYLDYVPFFEKKEAKSLSHTQFVPTLEQIFAIFYNNWKKKLSQHLDFVYIGLSIAFFWFWIMIALCFLLIILYFEMENSIIPILQAWIFSFFVYTFINFFIVHLIIFYPLNSENFEEYLERRKILLYLKSFKIAILLQMVLLLAYSLVSAYVFILINCFDSNLATFA